jgi:Na+-transporting NADH:ubiquinone oxidoreductase subunit NqrB
MITFNSFVLIGLIVRVVLVVLGGIISINIIGFKNINFLKQYITKKAFSSHRLFFWLVAFLSLFYFEYLVSHSQGVTFSEVFDKSIWLSLLVLFLLFAVVSYAFLELKDSVKNAKKVKADLENGKFAKDILSAIDFASWFVPGGFIAKGAILTATYVADYCINNEIEEQLTTKIIQNIEAMIIIVAANLSIVVVSTYLITDKIIFW